MKKKRYSMIVLASVGLLGVVYLFVSRFTIHEVVVEGVDARIHIDRRLFPDNLLFFPTLRLREELIRAYPEFLDILVIKRYPSTLVLHFTPRVPMARLVLPSRSVGVDPDGIVLGDTVDVSLPALYMPVEEIHIGQKITGTGITTSLAFLSVMRQDGHIESIRLGEQRSLIVKTGETIILLDQNSDGSQIAHTLQGLLSGFRIRGTRPKVVDLRFDKSVVTF